VNFQNRLNKFGEKLVKLKLLSKQISKAKERNDQDDDKFVHDTRVGQGRAGLSANNSYYSPEER